MVMTKRNTNRVPPNSKLLREDAIYKTTQDNAFATQMRRSSDNMLKAIVATGKLYGPMPDDDKRALIEQFCSPEEKRKYLG